MSKPKRPFKKHFRVNRSKEASIHPAYVIRKEGNSYDYIGLVHSPVTDNRRNIKLRKNPNPKDNRASYIRPFFRSGPIKNSLEKGFVDGDSLKKTEIEFAKFLEQRNKKSGTWRRHLCPFFIYCSAINI
ncbi:MAG: hypothetical protein IJR08_03015 [Bacilli bacterium]|nr:hypothetical protein [Bacilli bacterium]